MIIYKQDLHIQKFSSLPYLFIIISRINPLQNNSTNEGDISNIEFEHYIGFDI